MPYQGELASKTSHSDIVRNPDVARFLESCEYLTLPSDDEAKVMAARFQVPPGIDDSGLPSSVIAFDGSYYESSINDKLPSTKIGYVKVGSILIDTTQFKSLRVGRFVDPFRVAAINENNSPLTFTLPSANIRWSGRASVRESFRYAIDSHLCGSATRFNADDPQTSLRSTLFHLASIRTGNLGTGSTNRLKIHRCPACGEGPVEVEDVPDQQYCGFCGAEVYPSDCLRIWEEVTDFQSNVQALSRFMLAVEHLLPIHYIRFLADNSLDSLGSTAFFIDGPLAVFGNPAWLHASIMKFIARVNARLDRVGQPKLLMIGLQKSGQIVDHVSFIDRFLPANRIYSIADDYRYQYILSGRDPAGNGFGYETYYGQDFIYKTPSSRIFVFAVPYPFESKDNSRIDFMREKTELGRYQDLARALALIREFESDLYQNAVIPIALAHRYTAISLVPGGRVLDLLTRRSLP